MGIGSIGLTLSITDKAFTSSGNITLFRHKHLESLKMRESVQETDCQISYVGYEPVRFASSSSLISYENDIQGNQIQSESFGDYQVFEGSTFLYQTDKIQVATRSVRDGAREIPLFLGMKFSPETTEAFLNVADQPDQIFWEWDSYAKVLYCSEPNFWDEERRIFKGLTVHYVEDGTSKSTLFRAEPVFKEASYLDIDPDTLDLFPNRPVYTLTETPLGFKFEVNTTGRVFVRSTSENNISVKRNFAGSQHDPWRVEVLDGRIGDTYSIREYDDQAWYPREGYRTFTHQVEVLRKDLLKVPQGNLVIDPDSLLHFDLVVRDKKGALLRALTTSTAKIGRPFRRWDITERDKVWETLSYTYDYSHGVVQVNNDVVLLDTDVVYATYVSEVNSYVYPHINLNPNHNTAVAYTYYLLYLVPDSISGDKSLYHIEYQYDSTGGSIITECNQLGVVSGLSTVREDVVGQSVDYFVTTYVDGYSFVKLASLSFQSSFRGSDLLVEDVRLRTGINYKRQKEVLERHPWIYFDEAYSPLPYEFPDKYISILGVDRERVLEDDLTSFEGHIRKHLSSAHGLIEVPGGSQPRVQNMFQREEGFLDVELMAEKPGVTIRLMQLAPGGEVADVLSDTLIEDIVLTYGTTVQTATIDVSAVAEEVATFYVVLVYDTGLLSHPSKMYKVRLCD